MFGWTADLPKSHPDRRRLECHLLECAECSSEFEIWQESLGILHSLPIEISEERAEAVNRRVMERIYAESPWLAEGKQTASERIFRSRLKIWAASFMAVFLISLALLAFSNSTWGTKSHSADSGLLPTAVAGAESVSGANSSYDLTGVSSGIADPFTAGISPAYPQYWIVLSMVAMGLAILAWRGLRRVRN
ncbi:zf-HC2 domain-containing protein [Paenibacillus pinistramenti]|uniref:zf-HC2 domain-containing protein n=1 Tax=Paenibacillus pinistramenti TaxID=1768003 RepID=UPI001EF05771|nr:zf-HC2 domain-containing protein [Paenibacillus pinistramenti]